MTTEQDTLAILPFLGDLTYREAHAFINGFYVGFVDGNRDHVYDRERHYWRAGFLLAALFADTNHK